MAASDESTPTTTLPQAAWISVSFWMTSWYQRSVKPLSGKVSEVESLNEKTISSAIGA